MNVSIIRWFKIDLSDQEVSCRCRCRCRCYYCDCRISLLLCKPRIIAIYKRPLSLYMFQTVTMSYALFETAFTAHSRINIELNHEKKNCRMLKSYYDRINKCLCYSVPQFIAVCLCVCVWARSICKTCSNHCFESWKGTNHCPNGNIVYG